MRQQTSRQRPGSGQRSRITLVLACALLFAAQGLAGEAERPSFLLLIGDDIGVDRIGAYREQGTMYEGGVNVPLIVFGPGVAQGECDALVNATDLFATIAELAGYSSSAEDSVSLVPYLRDPQAAPLREWVYAEKFQAQRHRKAIRETRYKLIRAELPSGIEDELYDLESDPFERTSLLRSPMSDEARLAYRWLKDRLP